MRNKEGSHHTQKIIILGLLQSGKISGYEIKKFLNQKLNTVAQPENKSVYYPLKKMVQERLIAKSSNKSETNRQKTIYSITSKGKKTFQKICNELLLSEKRPFFDMDMPLYFLPFLEKKDVAARLKLRIKFFHNAKKWLKNKKKETIGEYAHMLLSHQVRLLDVEERFLTDVIQKIKNNQL